MNNRPHFARRLFAAGLTAVLAVMTVSAPAPAFTAAVAPYTYHFPRDHGAHNDYQTEWWYYTGHLRTRTGRRFGFELTFFRIALSDKAVAAGNGVSHWRGNQLYPAHFAITDDQGKRFFYDERLAREALHGGYAAMGHLQANVGAWTLRQRADGAFEIAARSGGNALTLVMSSRKPPAVHGEGRHHAQGRMHELRLALLFDDAAASPRHAALRR